MVGVERGARIAQICSNNATRKGRKKKEKGEE
jgi:hypothetical protein